SGPGAQPPFGGDGAKRLTPTERAILRGLRDGQSLSQIAAGLKRSELTIRTHIRNARAKFEIRGSGELRRRLQAGELDHEIADPD
ncbi:MAG TPA: helix-turn-helix transcriptional regulator, partial [Candidatus Limnocylindrales bacterium]|nr:helix-turn-helix transcriptional regulator [Candidatus Limnocylindrales bacterium]